MGWFWQSSEPKAPAASPGSAASQATMPSSTRPLSNGEDSVDREVQKFFEMLEADVQQSSSKGSMSSLHPPPAQTEPASKPSSSSSWFSLSSSPKDSSPQQQRTQSLQHPQTPATHTHTRTRGPSPATLAMAEHTLPTSMSCRDAFDYAWHCNSAGAQWTAVYRYGGVQSCSELWDDFWFCMRTRSWSDETRAAAIAARARAREHARYYAPGRPSSEDVWESRDERIASGEAFRMPLPAAGVDDVEFQRVEVETRRRIRQGLGLETGE